MTGKQGVLVAAVAALMMMHSSDAPACGPAWRKTEFTQESFPRFEVATFSAGELGVVRPTHWRRFLLVAYRYFSATPLTDAEKAAFAGHPPRTYTGSVGGEQRWRDARAKVPGFPDLPVYLPTFRRVPDSQWQSFSNCHNDAFATAADTLNNRIEQFGADHDGVRRWVAAQDVVFSNCSEGAAIPPDPEPGLSPVLAADRRYQIAAANFYALNLAEAQSQFEAVAGDDSSPWRDIAPYLVARSLLRRATLDPRPGHVDLDMVSRAAFELRRILEDPSRESIHPAARDLLDYTDAKLAPGRRLVTVAKALTSPTNEADFLRNLIDYEFLMDRDLPAKSDARGESDLIDWTMAFQAGELDYAIEKWRETGSTPWLVAAMVHAPASHPAARELRTAAQTIDLGSPAWSTLTHHRLRQMRELGQNDAARVELDEVLPRIRTTLPIPALNLFLEQRFALALNLDEALRFAPRVPIARLYDDGVADASGSNLPDETPEPLFDSDSVRMFNQGLPLDTLAEAAASQTLPQHLRAQLTLIAWVRAVLLERWDTARELAAPLRAHFPSLESDLDQWQAAAEEDHRFATAYLLLRHPRMKPHLFTGTDMKLNLEGIDDLRDNWWCSFALGEELDQFAHWRFDASSLGLGGEAPEAEPPDFLTAAERDVLAQEWKTLQSIETAPNYLSAIATSYAATHPDDPRSPEALHLAVRATRFGCTDSGTGGRSRAAFQLLHRRWPNSQWAQDTPYWFR